MASLAAARSKQLQSVEAKRIYADKISGADIQGNVYPVNPIATIFMTGVAPTDDYQLSSRDHDRTLLLSVTDTNTITIGLEARRNGFKCKLLINTVFPGAPQLTVVPPVAGALGRAIIHDTTANSVASTGLTAGQSLRLTAPAIGDLIEIECVAEGPNAPFYIYKVVSATAATVV